MRKSIVLTVAFTLLFSFAEAKHPHKVHGGGTGGGTGGTASSTSLCPSLRLPVVAQWVKPRKAKCPANTTLFNGYCQATVNVAACHETNGFGSCQGQATDRYTRECLNWDACREYTGSLNGFCSTEQPIALASISAAPYCTNVSGQWADQFGETLVLTQDQSSQTVTGVGALYGRNGGCGGNSSVDGFNFGDLTNLTAHNPIISGSCDEFTYYDLVNNCDSLDGTWHTNAGASGNVNWIRN